MASTSSTTRSVVEGPPSRLTSSPSSFAADAGVHVANSAGNSGPGAGTIFNPSKVPWLTTVGANTQTRFFAGTVELGSGVTYEGASVTLGTEGKFPLVDAAAAR